MAIIGVSALALTSCGSEEKRLASDMTGIWTASPETFAGNQAVTATITDTYCFSPDSAMVSDKFPIGPMEVSAEIQMNTQVLASGDGQEPLSLSASALATVLGTWMVTDDDEVQLSFDPTTITVSVDPDQIVTTGALIGGSETTSIDSMKPQVAANLEQNLRASLATRYTGVRMLDDVKVKGNTLKYEVGHRDFVMTRAQ